MKNNFVFNIVLANSIILFYLHFQSLASCNLFGVIEGSNSETERIRSASETSKRSVAGRKYKKTFS